jgi:3-methyladenine DNA glycosylase Tag
MDFYDLWSVQHTILPANHFHPTYSTYNYQEVKLGHPNSAQYSDSYIGASQVDDNGQEQLCSPTFHAGICWHVVLNILKS